MKKDISPEQCYLRACDYCAKAERSPQRVRQKLHEWGANPEWVTQIVDKLIQGNYINTLRYAEAFARDKHRLCGWGKQRIKQQLICERIPQADIHQALQALESDYNSDEKLRSLLESKLRSLPASLETYKKRDRLIRAALYKGYTYTEAQKLIATLISPAQDESDEDEYGNEPDNW